MNVLVIGAAGNVGRRLVQQLAAHPQHTPIAQVRHLQQKEALQAQGIETRLVDLEDSVDSLRTAMQGADAIIFSAGSGGSTGDDKTLLVDLDGAIKTMEAATQTGIKRYIMVSALWSEEREKWHTIKPYFAAKYYADKALMQSSLDYTILRPGVLKDEAGTGRVTTHYVAGGVDGIPRDDVAAFAITALTADSSIGKAVDLVSGEHSIHTALVSL